MDGRYVLSPILLLLLAGLWAAVLIPATRGGRDASYDGRSIQGFSTAMRVLSRRTSPSDGRYIMVPTAEVTAGPPPVRMQQRRRRTLIRLFWVAGVTLAAAILLGGPWPFLHVAVDGLLVAYVVRLRRLALVRAEAHREARRAELVRREAEHRAAYEAAHPRPEVEIAVPEPDQRRAANA